jgi:adenine/guanine/hypoxanthine permease
MEKTKTQKPNIRTEAIARAIPPGLRIATAAGIGIFLTFIGLKNAGLITSDPVTFVKLGTLGREALLAILGLAVIIWLMKLRSSLAFLAGIFLVTLISWLWGLVKAPASFFSAPDFGSVFLKLDIWGALKWSLLPAFLTIILIPLTFSITQGILWGFSSHTALYLMAGRRRELHPVMYALALVSVGLLVLEHGKFS